MIQINDNSYNLIKDKFDCQERGKVEIKGKGLMKTWFVNKQL
ncbi:MAG: adenylate/guanylate cyclase domain-containing protein [Candidatus Hodarchaeales archaeon]